MTKEDKDLLLKDLCVRLPYKPQVEIIKDGTSITDKLTTATIKYLESGYWDVKPYLFSLSSMTEEQKEDLLLTIVGKEGLRLFSVTKDGIISNDKAEQSFENFSLNNINFSNKNTEVYIDWLNKNHFDFRGLIEKGLAIDCTNLNIY
jgi:hypothetical protein